MVEEAKIRVRLDTSGARGDLAELYRQMANAPTVRTAGGYGGGGGGGGIGGMGISWGSLGKLAGAAYLGHELLGPAVSDAHSMVGALAAGPSRMITDFLFGSAPAAVRASESSLEQVKRAMGFAVGMGAPMGAAKSLYDSLMTYEEPKAKGERAIDTALGGKALDAMMAEFHSGGGGVLGIVVRAIEEVRDAVRGITTLGGIL